MSYISESPGSILWTISAVVTKKMHGDALSVHKPFAGFMAVHYRADMHESQVRQNGPAIREIRQREGLTIAELATRVSRRIPLSEPHLRNIENELKSASTAHLAAIAKELNASLESLRRVREDTSGLVVEEPR